VGDSLKKRIRITCDNANCPCDYLELLTPSEFEAALYDREFRCPRCRNELNFSGLELRCFACKRETHWGTLHEVRVLLRKPCIACSQPFSSSAPFTLQIAGSWSELLKALQISDREKRVQSLMPHGRSDYWEGVVHFCDASEFVAIYKDRRIRAASTGLYMKRNPESTKAVCLSESTPLNWSQISKQHGAYGFVFRKSDVVQVKGAPVIYLPEPTIELIKKDRQQIPRALWPYLSKLAFPSESQPQKRHYFIHEREWRVANDLQLDRTRPFAVTFPPERPHIDNEESILYAAHEFGFISANTTE